MEVKIAMRQIEKSIPYVLLAALCFFLGAASGVAQQTKMPTQKAVSKARMMHTAPAKVIGPGKVLAPKETLSGTVSMVDATQNLVVVTGANGIPYDFQVTRGTRITVAGQKSGIDGLADQVNKQISVEFVPRAGGNFAESIEISG
jgi:hypothetical protein